MSEKRILIKEFTISPCTGCSCAGENDCDNCNDWYMWQSLPTREQAIRKMCDGYFKAKDKGLTESGRVEAALNALLEGHDDE